MSLTKVLAKSIGASINLLSVLTPKKAGEISLKVFCSPIRKPLTKKQIDFLETGKAIRIEGGKDEIKVYQWGNGSKKIVLMHGWQSHSFRWKKYVETFDLEEYTIYAIDAPAHGSSQGKIFSVPLYSDALELFLAQIGDVHAVVAHSIGCFSALFTFHRAPHYTPNRLILMAPPENALEFFDFYQKTLGLTSKSIKLTKKSFLREFGQDPDYFSASAFASTLKIQGLIIHDALDDETPVENAKKIARVWKNAKLHITNGLGHNLKSENIVTETIKFLADEE